MKKNKKLIILGILLLVLAGCTNIRDTNGNIMQQYIITWGDKFPFRQEGYGWFATFITWPLAQLFNFLSRYVGAFWSVIIGTLLLNLLKFRSTINSTVQQEKMSALQPQIDALNKKYEGKDDQQSKMQLAQETQQLYADNDINMFASLGGLLLQFPMIIAMFQAVQRAESIINGTVLGQPFAGTPKEGFASGNWVYISIFLVMAVVQAASMLIPQEIQKRKRAKQGHTEPAPGQNMMFMSLAMIIFFGYTWNIGMSIYWGISALTQLVQTLVIHKHYTNK